VVGGSIGGLLAGLALAEVCDEVVLVERGKLVDAPLPRAGVPQDQHAHGLLAGGLAALEQLLPGLCRELEQSGCPSGDNLRDAAWVFAGRRLARGESGVRGMTMARPLLEHAIRRRVLALPNVSIRAGTRVLGLRYVAGKVTGVRLAAEPGAEEPLTADLVVDASGRHPLLPEWLTVVGLEGPRIEEVALETRYVSQIYRRRPHHLNGGIALCLVASRKLPRGGVALALDGERWLVSQYALGGARPPQDHASFVAFARTLSSPALAELLEDTEPLGEAHSLRFPSSIRRHYEEMRDFPQGLLVCGDALASFNPTYGQGITVVAKQAVLLRRLCRHVALPELGKVFAEQAAPIVDVAWNAAVGPALAYSGVRGRMTLKMRLANAYLPRVIARAHEDVQVATALLRVMQFLAPPASLFAPRLLLRVLAGTSADADRAASPVSG